MEAFMVRTLAALACAAAMTIACAAASAEPVKIKVSWATTPSHLTPLLFHDKSKLKHNGKSYEVETLFLRGSGEVVTALAADELTVGSVNFQTLHNLINRAQLDIRVVADVFQTRKGRSNGEFYVDPNKIKSVPDLKGKRVAINARGSGVDAAVRARLGQDGLKDGTDYTVVEIRFPAMLPALDAGRVDMAFINLPFSLHAQAKGYRMLFDFVDVMGEQQTVMWVAKDAWLKANRAAVVDFMEDALRMRRWLEDPANRDKSIEVLAAVTRQPAKELEPWAFKGIDSFHDPDMLPDVALLQKNVYDLVPFGLADKRIDITPYVDLSYVKEAAARLKNGGQ